MKQVSSEAQRALLSLQRAVIDALEKKRRLGQSAVIWRNGRVIAVGEDAPEHLKPPPGEEVSLEQLIASAKAREAALVEGLEREQE